MQVLAINNTYMLHLSALHMSRNFEIAIDWRGVATSLWHGISSFFFLLR